MDFWISRTFQDFKDLYEPCWFKESLNHLTEPDNPVCDITAFFGAISEKQAHITISRDYCALRLLCLETQSHDIAISQSFAQSIAILHNRFKFFLLFWLPIGVANLLRFPAVLQAVDPWNGLKQFVQNVYKHCWLQHTAFSISLWCFAGCWHRGHFRNDSWFFNLLAACES